MPDSLVCSLVKELSLLPQVEAVALGGSRAGEVYDEKSDYDIYLYVTGPVDMDARREVLTRYCSYMELGNAFWEYEDNCVLASGVDMDILYRDLDQFARGISDVVDRCIPHNSYTTCMWHNLLTCKILFDRDGRLTALKKKYDVPYPEELRRNITERSLRLLRRTMPAFEGQLCKAAKRGDTVSVNHRTAELVASYFDALFALNKVTHPGEKRLIRLALEKCPRLPEGFPEDLEGLFGCLFTAPEEIPARTDRLISRLEALAAELGVSLPSSAQEL